MATIAPVPFLCVLPQCKHILKESDNPFEVRCARPQGLRDAVLSALPVRDLCAIVEAYHGAYSIRSLNALSDVTQWLEAQSVPLCLPTLRADGTPRITLHDRELCLAIARWSEPVRIVGWRDHHHTSGGDTPWFDMMLRPGDYPDPPPLVRECSRLGLSINLRVHLEYSSRDVWYVWIGSSDPFVWTSDGARPGSPCSHRYECRDNEPCTGTKRWTAAFVLEQEEANTRRKRKRQREPITETSDTVST